MDFADVMAQLKLCPFKTALPAGAGRKSNRRSLGLALLSLRMTRLGGN